MSSAQINVRTSPIKSDELDQILGTGFFKGRTEAVNEAFKFSIRRYKAMEIVEQIESRSTNVETGMSRTDALMGSMDEGDL